MPLEALTVVVPESVPPPGFVPSAAVIEAEEEVTVLPKLSCTATVGEGLIEEPVPAFAGCCDQASFAAAPGVTVIDGLAERAVMVPPLVDASAADQVCAPAA